MIRVVLAVLLAAALLAVSLPAVQSAAEASAADASVRTADDIRETARTLAAVPSGLPVTPVPSHWYATVNAWGVGVKGGYRRCARRPATR